MTASARVAVATIVAAGIVASLAPGTRRAEAQIGVDAASGLPLKPSRTIRYSTNEGTWMSLDVSPDGQTIVFDLVGDLYTLPIAGGKAVPLTTGMAFDSQPRFSPEGSRVAFMSDRDGWVNIWVLGLADHSLKQVSHEVTRKAANDAEMLFSPAWTPDGRRIVVSQRVGTGNTMGTRVVEFDIESGSGWPITDRDVTSGAAPNFYWGPATSSDPTSVFVARKPRARALDNWWQIVRIDKASGKEHDETSPLSGISAMRPTISRDGRYLAYGASTGDGTGLRVLDRKTDHDEWLVRDAQRDVADWAQFESRDLLPGSSFTPDSRALVTSYGGRIWSVDLATKQASEIPFQADIVQGLGPLQQTAFAIGDTIRVRALRSPSFSPDGRAVVFAALDRIWIAPVPVDRTPHAVHVIPRRLTHDDRAEFGPVFSADGKSVFFSTLDDVSGGALWNIDLDGVHQPTRVSTQPGVFLRPAASRDGRFLYVPRFSVNDWHAVLRSYVRGEPASLLHFSLVQIPTGPGGDERVIGTYGPSWGGTVVDVLDAALRHSPQTLNLADDRVFVHDGKVGIVAYRTAGGERDVWWPLRSESKTANHDGAFDVQVSPDGRHAMLQAQKTMDAWLMAVPPLLPQPAAIASVFDDGFAPTATRVSSTPVDAVGWTPQGAPFFSVGASIFVGAVPSGPSTTTFQRYDVDLTVPRDKASGAMLLTNARIITMRGNEVLERADLLVRDGRIAGVGPAGTLHGADAHVVDVAGSTIIPGLIDAHDHVGYAVSWTLHTSQEWRLLAELAFGITTLRDPVGYSTDFLSHKDRALAGTLISPRLYTVHPPILPVYFGDGRSATLERTRELLRLYSDFYDTETIKQYTAGDRRVRQFIARAAHEQHLMGTNEGDWKTAKDLTYVLDGYAGFEHQLPATPQYRDVTELIARSGTIQTPTIGVRQSAGFSYMMRQVGPVGLHDPRLATFVPASVFDLIANSDRYDNHVESEQDIRLYSAQLNKIVAAGGCVGMGAHGNIPGLGPHWEMWLYTMGGMSNHDVLKTATVCNARALGHQQDLGSIEPGKIADLVVLSANPLDDIHNTTATKWVIKDGRLYDPATLDQKWPTEKPLGHQWWQAVQ